MTLNFTMTDWKQIEDTPSAEMHKRWSEEEAAMRSFEEKAEFGPLNSVEFLDHLVPERSEWLEERERRVEDRGRYDLEGRA